MKDIARKLRSNATDAERVLWSSLRLLKHQGLHFRRQASFEQFVVDFACHSAKLIVEVDGAQHNTEEGVQRDEDRTAYLKSRGYRVMRFQNFEVFESLGIVVDTIIAKAKSPHPKSLRDFDLPARGR